MKKIPLPNGQFALVDDEDYDMLMKFKWSVTKPGHRRTVYARTNVKGADGKYFTESMHRMVLGLKKYDGKVVDHINGNGLDNRKSNLRVCEVRNNAANVKTPRNNTSGYKGVHFRKDRSVWIAEIRVNWKLHTVAYTRCKHFAARKYNEKALEYFGEFAWLNNVEECNCDECIEYQRSKYRRRRSI